MKDKERREREATIRETGVNPWAGCHYTPLKGLSPNSLLVRSCFSHSDGENHIEVKSWMSWQYYFDLLQEYIHTFEVEYTSLRDEHLTRIADEMKDFGWSVYTPVYFFWIEDIKPAPDPRRIYK